MLYLLSYTDKQLTNSLLLASDWLTILVCVIWFDKERFIEKSKNMTGKIPLLLQILASAPNCMNGDKSNFCNTRLMSTLGVMSSM